MVAVETDRLRLRPWRQDDFEVFAAYYGQDPSARFVGGPMTRDRSWRLMAALVGHWALRGFGPWAAREKASGRVVGSIGLWQPEGWPELEVGYWLVETARGHGYATEAAARARDYAYAELGATTLVSYIHPDNEPSKRVADRLGAELEGTIELLDHGPHCVYRHPGPA